MAKVKSPSLSERPKQFRPALTPEARENQLISLAVDLVEQRLRDGTASSQETVHFLKLASSEARLKMEKLEEENKLLRAKTEAIQAERKNEEFYGQVMAALRKYNGQGSVEEDDDDYDEY